MKKIYILLPFILVLSAHTIYAAWSCQAKSRHLKIKYDPKTYYYVRDLTDKNGEPCTCNCKCYEYIGSFIKGICPKCGHYHDPDELRAEAAFQKALERKIVKLKKQKK